MDITAKPPDHSAMPGLDDEQGGGEPELSRLGRYTLVRRLGTGGMGEVYLGKAQGARGFEKFVAIKRILPQYSANKHVVNMLVDEARISVLLNHPNVVQVLELDEDGDNHFIVMEYVDGHALSRLIRRLKKRGDRVDPLLACFIVIHLLEGLHAAHTQRDSSGELAAIIHRDVSPQNVLLSMTGQVKVIDFGIARARDRLEATQGNQVKGKLRYMAPEQIKPSLAGSGGIDHRVDIFAAGIVLFEMLAMRQRFAQQGDIEIIDAILETDVPDLAAEGLIDDELMEIVRTALTRERKRRYKDAAAFSGALRAHLYARDPGFNNERLAKVMRRCFTDAPDDADVEEPPKKAAPQQPGVKVKKPATRAQQVEDDDGGTADVTRTQFRPQQAQGQRPPTTSAGGVGQSPGPQTRTHQPRRSGIPAPVVGAALGALVLIGIGFGLRSFMQPKPIDPTTVVGVPPETPTPAPVPATPGPTPTPSPTAPAPPPRSLLDLGSGVEFTVEVIPATATISLAYQPDPKYVSPARLKVQRGETIDLLFEATGFEPLRKRFVVEGDAPRVTVELVAIPMPLIVRPVPRDAEILVNGESYKTRRLVKPGETVTVVARHPFYFDAERTVTATPGLQQLLIDLTLQERPTPGKEDGGGGGQRQTAALVLTTTPPGADVIVDGIKIGRTPGDFKVSPGPHRITLKTQTAETTFAIDIAAGDVQKRSVTLE